MYKYNAATHVDASVLYQAALMRRRMPKHVRLQNVLYILFFHNTTPAYKVCAVLYGCTFISSVIILYLIILSLKYGFCSLLSS